MKPRRYHHYMSILLTGLLLVGCGTGQNDQPAPGGNQGAAPAPAPAGGQLSGKITASGSTALLPLVKQAANEFQKLHPNLTIDVSGGGSGTGLKQVSEGTVNIGNSDVEAGNEFPGLVDHQVAIAPFVLIVNNSVTVDNLTKEQAGKIFTGQIKNWKEVGGQDEKITIIGRAESSGSRRVIKQLVLPEGQDFAKESIVQDSSGSLRTAVDQTSGAIGYVDAPYATGNVKILKFDGVEYTPDNVINGTYKLFAYEHMYTKGEPDANTRAFLDYILSDEFQSTYVEQLKFISVNKGKK